MYINTAIETTDRLYPNEYTLAEKYRWCDELTAMIGQEYHKEYERVRLEPDRDGTYLLPEGVSYEMIDRIFDGRRDITKQDFRSYGIVYLSMPYRRLALPNRPHRAKGFIDVVYIRQQEPIRDIRLEDVQIYAYCASDMISIAKEPYFRVGDSIVIKAQHTIKGLGLLECDEYTIEAEILEDKSIIDVAKGGLETFFYLNEGALSAMGSNSAGLGINVDIMRIVTDKTPCPAPYDRMYIDWLNAKVCYYQHDYTAYNQHMTLFNGRLAAYQSWLKERDPMGDDGQLHNWW